MAKHWSIYGNICTVVTQYLSSQVSLLNSYHTIIKGYIGLITYMYIRVLTNVLTYQ
jgi:hypothetical protein